MPKYPCGQLVCKTTAPTKLKPTHNCRTREVWSAAKKAWCCKVEKIGCPKPTEAPTKKSCVCTKMYKPVKCSNGKTYGNSCEAGCAGQRLCRSVTPTKAPTRKPTKAPTKAPTKKKAAPKKKVMPKRPAKKKK